MIVWLLLCRPDCVLVSLCPCVLVCSVAFVLSLSLMAMKIMSRVLSVCALPQGQQKSFRSQRQSQDLMGTFDAVAFLPTTQSQQKQWEQHRSDRETENRHATIVA
jgi:hypothetical protein